MATAPTEAGPAHRTIVNGPDQSRRPLGFRLVARITPSELIADVFIVDPDGPGDPRGVFYETYRRSWFPLGREMVQGNRSDKTEGSVVGLHYHLHQADYWLCTRGTARVVLHDLRVGSPTDGATETIEISEENCRGVFIPPGVAHGFASLSDLTLTYLVDSYYNPEDELGVAWDDPTIGADWGIRDPVLSDRDRSLPARGSIPEAVRPHSGLRR